MHGRRISVAAIVLAAVLAPATTVAHEGGVAFTTPTDGDMVSGVVDVTGTAHDDEGIRGVRLQVDDGPLMAVDAVEGDGITVTWRKALDVTGLTNGAHTLTAHVADAGGEWATASITIHVGSGDDTDLVAVRVAGTDTLGPSTVLEAVVENAGSTDATGIALRFDVRYRDRWDVIGTAVADVDAGATTAVRHEWTQPTAVGRFDVRVIVDPEDAVAEVDEANNAATGSTHFWTGAVEGQDATDPRLPDPTSATTHVVLMLGHDPLERTDAYGPHVVVVREGDSVRWLNADPRGVPHTASRLRWDAQQFDTGALAPGAESEAVRFDEPGTFVYYCALHQTLSPSPTSYVVVLPRTDHAPPRLP